MPGPLLTGFNIGAIAVVKDPASVAIACCPTGRAGYKHDIACRKRAAASRVRPRSRASLAPNPVHRGGGAYLFMSALAGICGRVEV